MNEKKFNELLESVKEVGLIDAGKSAPSREFVVEKTTALDSSNVKTFAICISREEEELIPLKIYHVVLQPRQKTCTVKDENNETLVCPLDWFLPVEFSTNVEKILEETEMALA